MLYRVEISKRMLCPCCTCCVALAVWGVALTCIRTFPRLALMSGVAAAEEFSFNYFAVFRFCWKGTIEVFVCIDIPAHIITELPQKCSFLHTHALLKRSTFCDTHGSDRRKLNLDSSAKKNSIPIPQMTSCPCLTKLCVSGWQHQTYIRSPCTQSSLQQSVSHYLFTKGLRCVPKVRRAVALAKRFPFATEIWPKQSCSNRRAAWLV